MQLLFPLQLVSNIFCFLYNSCQFILQSSPRYTMVCVYLSIYLCISYHLFLSIIYLSIHLLLSLPTPFFQSFFLRCVYLRESKRDHEEGRGAEGEREDKQTVHWAQRLTHGSMKDPAIITSAKIKNVELNWLSCLGTPLPILKVT